MSCWYQDPNLHSIKKNISVEVTLLRRYPNILKIIRKKKEHVAFSHIHLNMKATSSKMHLVVRITLEVSHFVHSEKKNRWCTLLHLIPWVFFFQKSHPRYQSTYHRINLRGLELKGTLRSVAIGILLLKPESIRIHSSSQIYNWKKKHHHSRFFIHHSTKMAIFKLAQFLAVFCNMPKKTQHLSLLPSFLAKVLYSACLLLV